MFNITQVQTKRSLVYYCALIVFCSYQSIAYAYPPCEERIYREGIPGCKQVLQCAHAGRKIQLFNAEPESPLSCGLDSSSDNTWYIGFQYIPFGYDLSKQASGLTCDDQGVTLSNWLIPDMIFSVSGLNGLFSRNDDVFVNQFSTYKVNYVSNGDGNQCAGVKSKHPLFLGVAAVFPTGNSESDIFQPQESLGSMQENEINSVKDITDPELKMFVVVCDKIESAYFNAWDMEQGKGCQYCNHINDVLLAKLYRAFQQEGSNSYLQNLAEKLYDFRKDKIDKGVSFLEPLSSVEH